MDTHSFDLIDSHDFQSLNALIYQKIFEDFPTPIWLSGPDSLCWYFNKKWLELRGRTMEQEIGIGWAEGIHPEDYDFCLNHYLTHFKARQPFSMEYRLLNGSGEYFWILDIGIPFYGVQDDFKGYIGACYDITAEKEMIQKLTAAKEEADNALKAKDNLLSYVSHEIRSPLNILYGYTQMLMENQYDEETNETIRQMNSSAVLMVNIIDNLLDLSKFESRHAEVNKEETLLAHLIEQIENIYKRKIEASGLSFFIHTDSDLPAILMLDEMKMIQIISNLISNSIKFTQVGYIRLTLGYDFVENLLLITIEDTGSGVNREKQKHLFEPYVQGDQSISKIYGGTGLGLSIVKTLIDLLGGTIQMTTAENQGTCFKMTFPT